MNFKEYQKKASTTAVYPRPRTRFDEEGASSACEIIPIMYCALGLTGEAGEVAENVKKSWRNEMKIIPSRRDKIADELGDVLWYASQLATELGLDLEYIASNNIDKLSNRKAKGELKHE